MTLCMCDCIYKTSYVYLHDMYMYMYMYVHIASFMLTLHIIGTMYIYSRFKSLCSSSHISVCTCDNSDMS